MRLYYDTQLDVVYGSLGNLFALTNLGVKGDTTPVLDLVACNGGTAISYFTGDTVIKAVAKPHGETDIDPPVTADIFTLVAGTPGYATSYLRLDGSDLLNLMHLGDGIATNDVGPIVLDFEITIQQPGQARPSRSQTITLTVDRPVARDDDAAPQFPGSQIAFLQNLPAISDRRGGDEFCLDSVATIGRAIGQAFYFFEADPGQNVFAVLKAGPADAGDNNQVAPEDYQALTNNVHFLLYPQAPTPIGTTPGTVAKGDDARLVFGYSNYAVDAANAIDSRIAGKTASATTLNLFSAGNFTTGTGFIRNTQAWVRDIDLTCISSWNSTGQNLQAGTAITPRHVWLANHYSNPSGGSAPMTAGVTTIKFLARDNVLVTRTLTAFARVGSTDILIGTLDSDLPATVTPAQLLPALTDTQRSTYFPAGTPVIYSNQAKEARVGEVASYNSTSSDIGIRSALAANRTTWTVSPTAAIIGDSGSPVGLILNGRFTLLGGWFTTGSIPLASTTANLAAVASITGTNYPLSIAAVNLLGTASMCDTGTQPGQVPVLNSSGLIDPALLPQVPGSLVYSEQLWDGTSDVTVNSGTTVMRLTGALTPGVAYRNVTLPASPTNGQVLQFVAPPRTSDNLTGLTFYGTQAGNYRATLGINFYHIYTFIAGGGQWQVDDSIARLGEQAAFSSVRGSSVYCDSDLVVGNVTTIHQSAGAQFGGLGKFALLASSSSAQLIGIGLTAGQSARVKADGTALEAFTAAAAASPPASATDAGVAGSYSYDSSYIYICIATNTWHRVAVSSW